MSIKLYKEARLRRVDFFLGLLIIKYAVKFIWNICFLCLATLTGEDMFLIQESLFLI